MHPACALCRGACCEFFALPVRGLGWPEDVTRWLELHGQTVATAVEFNCACTKLVDGKCSIYASRPHLCSEYEVGGDHCRYTVETRRAAQADAILKLMP